jgi:hypothetical protein
MPNGSTFLDECPWKNQTIFENQTLVFVAGVLVTK